MNNKLEVIGIDHGWSMMKTVTQVFVTGVKEITTTPALFGDVLEYDGKYYKIGTVRQEVKDGAMLSGGQKQKIALARALVHDKPIIIFDEATSNTDAYSEQQINGLLDTRLKDKTVIVITHKKEVLSKVDQIVVLKEGVVADLGRYDDLVGKSDELNVMLEKAE